MLVRSLTVPIYDHRGSHWKQIDKTTELRKKKICMLNNQKRTINKKLTKEYAI